MISSSAKPLLFDVIVIGAGAAGMMCAIEAGKRGRRVLLVDHAAQPGEKIRISGGGRCNFTNLDTRPEAFISQNPSFCISALRRYRPADFIRLLETHQISWHEKSLGQLFCDGSARQVVQMLLSELRVAGAELRLAATVANIARSGEGFHLRVGRDVAQCRSLVIACGGKSIPKMGATGFGYDIAAQFGVPVVETRPALVPLTFDVSLLDRLKPLAGVAASVVAEAAGKRFAEAMLFTHRGLSGPAILQVSSYWREGAEVRIDLAPGIDMFALLRQGRGERPRQSLAGVLSDLLPRRLAQLLAQDFDAPERLADVSDRVLRNVANAVNDWRVKPVGTEGYRTAEVTLGGVDTKALNSRTMAVSSVPGLYFIGEVVDVTGWLGGYNFHWAWASGWCAGQAV